MSYKLTSFQRAKLLKVKGVDFEFFCDIIKKYCQVKYKAMKLIHMFWKFFIFDPFKFKKTSILLCIWEKEECVCVHMPVSLHLIHVKPQSHILFFNPEPLRQIIVNVLYCSHSAEAASVGQHPLQRSTGRWHVTYRTRDIRGWWVQVQML